MKNFIQQSCSAASKAFAEAMDNWDLKIFDIDCGKIYQRFKMEDIRDSAEFGNMFEELQAHTERPAVYVFEIVKSPISNEEIVQRVNKLENLVTPATKSHVSPDSKTLYVGKVEGCFWGRLIQHFGIHKTQSSHGLQLAAWAQEIGLQLRLQVCFFSENMKGYVEVVEKALADKCLPIIGKH